MGQVESRLRAGVATADITAPPGVDLTGAAFGPARGVLHPLQAKAICLEQGTVRLVLFACDLLGVEEAWARQTRCQIGEALGTSADAVMIACTHTHGAPATIFLRNWGRKDEAYLASLRDRLVQVAAEALRRLGPAQVAAGQIACPGVAVNRSLGEASGVDEQLGLLRLDDADGHPLAWIVNYGCHAVNLHSSGLITPDFPYYLERAIQPILQVNVPVLFLSGAGGDLNPANFRAQTPSESAAAETGGKLAAKAVELASQLRPMVAPALRQVIAHVPLPLAPLPDRGALQAAIEEARAKLAAETDHAPTNWNYCKHKTALEWAQDALAAVESGHPAATRPMEVQAFGLGEAAIVGIPGELFCELGIAIRRSGLMPQVMIATQANGTAGYLPTRLAFEKRTYEAAHCPRYLGTYFYASEVGEVVRDAALGLLQRVARNSA